MPDTEFQGIFRAYYSRVFAYLYGSTLDFEYARELTLVVFLRSIEEGVSAKRPLRLFQIAREVVFDRWLVSNRVAQHDDGLDQGSRAVLSALGAMQSTDREMLSLRFDAGLSDAEIAQVINANEDDVRVALTRALSELRSGLVPERHEM